MILRAAAAVELRQPSDADCCVYARLVLRGAFGSPVDTVPAWRWHLVAELGAGPWEPPRAAYDAGIAFSRETPGDRPHPPRAPASGHWALCQGWRDTPLAPGSTGHTWLYKSLTAEVGLLVDSTRSRGPRVSGFVRWSELVAGYRGGVAVALLRRPPG